jgi:hypothetical protein
MLVYSYSDPRAAEFGPTENGQDFIKNGKVVNFTDFHLFFFFNGEEDMYIITRSNLFTTQFISNFIKFPE